MKFPELSFEKIKESKAMKAHRQRKKADGDSKDKANASDSDSEKN